MIPSNRPGATAELSVGVEDVASVFDRPFWLTFASNLAMSVGTALYFRYADFVRSLGGSDTELGWIVGLGMVGSLLVRGYQGVGIDRHGPRFVWVVSCVGYIVAAGLHLLVPVGATVWAFPLRMLYQVSVAGFTGASLTFVTQHAPATRRAEVVGVLGISGFTGIMLGAVLGDLLPGWGATGSPSVGRFFITSAIFGGIALVCAVLATQGQIVTPRRRPPPLLGVLRRYHPGAVLLVGAAMGFGLALPQTYLRPYLAGLGIEHLAGFFVLYPIVGLVARYALRRFPDRYGVRPMILFGLASLAGAVLLLIGVQQAHDLYASAALFGVAHAVLFPAVVAGGTSIYPRRFHGVGTTFILATLDVGSLIGMPLAGSVLALARDWGQPPYVVLFLVVAGLHTLTALVFYAERPRGARLSQLGK